MRKSHCTFLSQEALAVLESLPRSAPGCSPETGATQAQEFALLCLEHPPEQAETRRPAPARLAHTFASFLINTGHSLYEVQKILGHHAPRVTMPCPHLDSATIIRAVDDIGTRIGAKKAQGLTAQKPPLPKAGAGARPRSSKAAMRLLPACRNALFSLASPSTILTAETGRRHFATVTSTELIMNILVIGGAGYIGSCTSKALARAGHSVTVYDNLSTGHRDLVKWGPLFEGDILDGDALRRCLNSVRPDGIIHFAAFSQVGESVQNPGKYIRNNIGGTLNILEAMREANIRNIVVSSSAAVYGIPETMPVTEDMPADPINPYGETKLFMERMLADFARSCGLSWTALRYFNAAGGDPDGETGERHTPETHLIPRALMAADGKLPDFHVMGNDYPTPDGTCIRDYIHVADLADAHIRAVERLLHVEDGHGIAMNLGTGTGLSVMEILNAIERVTERPLRYTMGPRRAGDPPSLVADASRALEILGWKPEHSGVEEIIRDAWNWYRLEQA